MMKFTAFADTMELCRNTLESLLSSPRLFSRHLQDTISESFLVGLRLSALEDYVDMLELLEQSRKRDIARLSGETQSERYSTVITTAQTPAMADAIKSRNRIHNRNVEFAADVYNRCESMSSAFTAKAALRLEVKSA